MNVCLCGCGQELPDGRRFVRGHNVRLGRPELKNKPTWNKGKHLSESHKDKIRALHLGVKDGPMSEERKRKIAEPQKGIPRPYARLNPQIFKKN